MNWLSPQAFWYLLIIPPVILLYFMKLRRQNLTVTATFLWDKIMKEARVDSFFQKLKFNILLILQILTILFIIWALARPYFKSLGVLTSETIIIIDNSASMGTRENNGVRLDLAREKIMQMLKQARFGSRFMLIESSDSARILSGFTNDTNKIAKLVSQVQLRDTGTDLKSAALLSVSLLKSHPDAGIILVGDRLPQKNGSDITEIPNFQYIPVGSNSSNLAITAFDVSGHSHERPWDLFVKVRNYSNSPRSTVLEIYRNDNLTEARQLTIPASGQNRSIFKVPRDFNGVLKARIKDPRGLDSDNETCCIIRDVKDFSILLISGENLFLQKVLSLIPSAKLQLISPEALGKTDLSKFNLVIWNECKVPHLEQGNHLFLGCTFADGSITDGESLSHPRIISQDSSNPLMRFLDLSAVNISSAYKVKDNLNINPVLESDLGPLIFMLEKGRFKGIYVMFSIMKSDWPLSPSFPMFFANLADYISRKGALPVIDNNKSGQTLTLNFLPKGVQLKIKGPGRIMEYTPRLVSGEPTLTLDRTGIYTVRADKETYGISSNLLDEDESRVEPDPPLRHRENAAADSRKVPLIREIWPELILVALLLLLLEWYIFNCRRV